MRFTIKHDVKMSKFEIILMSTVGIALLVFFYFMSRNRFQLSFIMAFTIFIMSCIYAFSNFKERILLTVINGSMFLFLYSRPLASLWRNLDIWYYTEYINQVTLTLLVVSTVTILVTYFLFEKYIIITFPLKDNKIEMDKKWVFILCATIYMIALCASLVVGIEKLHMMQGKNYEELYLGLESELPSMIRRISGLTIYFLVFCLALFPSKKLGYLLLGSYALTGVPDFVIGARTTLMTNLVFAFIYFVFREGMVQENEKHWIGRFEKTVIILAIPVMIIGLGSMNFTRSGIDQSNLSIVTIADDFIYSQGTTFDTVRQAVQYEEILRNNDVPSYVIANFLDYANNNTISKILFHTTPFPDGNNMIKATQGNDLSHRLSYLVFPDEYLAGHGRGSSFLAETYLDFGILGTILFSTLLSAVLYISNKIVKSKKYFLVIVVLLILKDIFMISRGQSLQSVMFIMQPYFYLSIVILLGIIYVNKSVIRRAYGRVPSI